MLVSDPNAAGATVPLDTGTAGAVSTRGVYAEWDEDVAFELRVFPRLPAILANWDGLSINVRIEYGIAGVTFTETIPISLVGAVIRRAGTSVKASVICAQVANAPALEPVAMAICESDRAGTPNDEHTVFEDVAANVLGAVHAIPPFTRQLRFTMEPPAGGLRFLNATGAVLIPVSPPQEQPFLYAIPNEALSFQFDNTAAGAARAFMVGLVKA